MAEAQENYKTVLGELDKMQAQIASLLPKHIPVERFVRIVRTAIANEPKMAEPQARRSLFNAALNCAKDGLLPDAREAVFNVYNVNVAPKDTPAIYEPRVVYIPMIAGVCKKVRQSGEIRMLDAQVVHENDEYDSWTDEHGPHFKYRKLRSGDRGNPIITFAYATMADGTPFFEELTEKDIQAIRNVSKAKNSGPWAGDFVDEMRRKSALKRLAKYRLPQSAELDEVMSRDNELYDFDDQPDARPELTAIEDKSEGKKSNGKPPNGKKTEESKAKPTPPPPDPQTVYNAMISEINDATPETFAQADKHSRQVYKDLAGREDLRSSLLRVVNARRAELNLKP